MGNAHPCFRISAPFLFIDPFGTNFHPAEGQFREIARQLLFKLRLISRSSKYVDGPIGVKSCGEESTSPVPQRGDESCSKVKCIVRGGAVAGAGGPLEL